MQKFIKNLQWLERKKRYNNDPNLGTDPVESEPLDQVLNEQYKHVTICNITADLASILLNWCYYLLVKILKYLPTMALEEL